ncbi:MAG TPA: hypothetical protein ENN25_02215 [Euryarchaeota archaeon]|nr:hypothetical protein [Euryarchaeota archaeon]
MNARELAWRVFSKEFNSSTLDIISTEEKAPSYVVTPLGAKVNRVFAVGVVTDTENIGSEESPMIRARMADPSGSYYISAGQFQPEATMVLRDIQPPEFVAIVGKARVYSPDESVRLLSIRPEVIRKCDSKLRDYWVYETCRMTLQRIDIMKEAMEMSDPSVEELKKLGYPDYLAEGAAAAAKHYENVDLRAFEELVRDSLREVASGSTGEIKEVDLEEMIVSPEADEVEVAEIKASSEDQEETVLQTIDSLDKDGKGSDWNEVVVDAKRRGIDRERLEEICTDLMDRGEIYEPELGRLKRI